MAIVPIAALIFAVANGFGFGKFIETQFREMFSAQPEVANWLLTLTHSYLTHAKTGIFYRHRTADYALQCVLFDKHRRARFRQYMAG